MEILHLDGNNFDATISGADKPVIVDFYADWCGPCKRIAPVIAELANQHDEIIFCKVNVDDNQDIAARYSIQSIPAFIAFKDGKLHKTMVGASSGQKILELAD